MTRRTHAAQQVTQRTGVMCSADSDKKSWLAYALFSFGLRFPCTSVPNAGTGAGGGLVSFTLLIRFVCFVAALALSACTRASSALMASILAASSAAARAAASIGASGAACGPVPKFSTGSA